MKHKRLFLLSLLFALILDGMDFLLAPICMVPLLGDVLDVFGVVVLYLLIGKSALLGLFELVPVIGDAFPSFVTATVLSLMFGGKRHG